MRRFALTKDNLGADFDKILGEATFFLGPLKWLPIKVS